MSSSSKKLKVLIDTEAQLDAAVFKVYRRFRRRVKNLEEFKAMLAAFYAYTQDAYVFGDLKDVKRADGSTSAPQSSFDTLRFFAEDHCSGDMEDAATLLAAIEEVVGAYS